MSAPAALPPSAGLGPAVVRWQTALDPAMPWLLLVLLALALGLLAWHWRRTQAQARLRGALGVALPAGAQPAAPPLAALLGLAAALGAAWGALAWGLSAQAGALLRWDMACLQAAGAVQAAWLHTLALGLAQAGDVLTLGVITLLMCLWLLRQRQPVLALGCLLAVAAHSVSVRVLKNTFARARPAEAEGLLTSGHSFPSGHAAGSLMVLGLLAWVLYTHWPAAWPARGRAWAVAALMLLVAAIAVSRVLLQVHYASDVAAGLLWAGMALALTVAALSQARRW
ncbi:MAG: phosphatase PAP2 family protein [Pseudomonadota bacterium]|nr:phosphatase PAP2 family protein [Pseudomonadota bacterium]